MADLTAKQEIANFLQSKQPGVVSSFTKNTLVKAAENMFTANGLTCPVKIVEVKGKAYIISRDTLVINGNGNHGD